MYNLLLLILLAGAGLLISKGLRERRRGITAAGAVFGVATILFFGLLDFWGELLWFEALGFEQRFLTEILANGGFAIGGAIFGAVVVYLLTLPLSKGQPLVRAWPEALGALAGGMWGFSQWEVILRYLQKVPTELKDPIIGQDTGFYLFSLPFYDALSGLLLLLTIIAFAAAIAGNYIRVRHGKLDFRSFDDEYGRVKPFSLYLPAAAIILVLALGKILGVFHLMYSDWGAVSGPGWTDVNIRMPAYIIVAVITVLLGLALLIPPARNWLSWSYKQVGIQTDRLAMYRIAATGVTVLLVWFLALTAVPLMFQWLRVEPNEITFEKPYIANNIEYTRYGFKLHDAEEREYPVSDVLTPQTVERNRHLFSNIRLWDWRALDAVFKQFQEIRLYYEFVDVDIDRYHIDGQYRQVMVSAREMSLPNLPPQSQTFVNKRFKYTHGYGVTLTNVSEFTEQGLPNLLIKDIPPKSAYRELEVERPQIYYGELTNTYVVVNSEEEEFDYPSGDQNIYIRYPGKGGVALHNLWRRFLFGWKFDGTKFFFSSYPTDDSRILFHRQIQDRVRKLAPFLHFDDDPYIVLADGKLYWIIDAYTTSDYFPYSEPFSSREIIEFNESGRRRALATSVASYMHGANYVRNSVKAVVDAFDGTVKFYVFDPDDPLIQVWQKIFPELFDSRDAMPPALQAHVRYPIDMLLVQGLVYAKYHMNEPEVFYNQEDLWIRATEKYYDQVQPVQPYYVMWELPDSDTPDFVLIQPFTPKNRQVLIGWIAGMCDGDNYGRLLAYKFPKEKRVLGPQQVETKIDQDSYLSGQLTLWDQRGSKVIRGNVLAIPIEETLIYVEPIYLQAETAAYPELRLVAVMHNDDLSYAESFDEAIRGLFQESSQPLTTTDRTAAPEATVEALIQDANEAFEDYLSLQSQKRFQEAAAALERLQQALQQLASQPAS